MGGNLRWQLHGDSQIPGNRNPCTLANCTWAHNNMTYHLRSFNWKSARRQRTSSKIVSNQVEPPKTYETTKQNTICQCLQQLFCFCLAFAVCCDLCQLQKMRTYFLESSIYIYIFIFLHKGKVVSMPIISSYEILRRSKHPNNGYTCATKNQGLIWFSSPP